MTRPSDGNTPSLSQVREASQELMGAIEQVVSDRGSPVTDDLAHKARELVTHASMAGSTTWDSEGRSELRGIIDRTVSLMQHAGVWLELPDLERYSGGVPTVERLTAVDALTRVADGRPLIGVQIEDADLRDLGGGARVRLVDCIVLRCRFDGLKLDDARLLHTLFEDCTFVNAHFDRLVATSSLLVRSSLDGAAATNGTFSGTSFDRVEMRDARFRDASFAASIFETVNATGADFSNALLDLASLRDTTLDDGQFVEAVFSGATIRDCTFHAADLKRAVFSGADVGGSSFTGAQMTDASFRNALDVSLAEFDASVLQEAEFDAIAELRPRGTVQGSTPK